MRDLNFAALIDPPNELSPAPLILNNALIPIVETFGQNVRRIRFMATIPMLLVASMTAWQRFVTTASFTLLQKSDANLNAKQKQQIIAEANRLADIWKKTVPEENDQADLLEACSTIKSLSTEPDEYQGFAAILQAQILGSWTAFEVLATDLWIAAVNARPLSLGEKMLLAPRPEREKAEPLHPTVPEVGKTKAKHDSIRISVLRKYGFNLSNKIGSIVHRSRKFDFNRFSGIRLAYTHAFGDSARDVFAKHDKLPRHEAIRNLLIHRGGVVDTAFAERMERYTDKSKLVIGDTIFIDAGLSRLYSDAAVLCSLDLIKFVDDWMDKNQEPSDDNEGS